MKSETKEMLSVIEKEEMTLRRSAKALEMQLIDVDSQLKAFNKMKKMLEEIELDKSIDEPLPDAPSKDKGGK